jgi:hypothetical protein
MDKPDSNAAWPGARRGGKHPHLVGHEKPHHSETPASRSSSHRAVFQENRRAGNSIDPVILGDIRLRWPFAWV